MSTILGREKVACPLFCPDKQTIRELFDHIAPHYDRINTLLSFGLDEVWRRRAVGLIVEGNERSILDLGVGTGKFLKRFFEKKAWEIAVGMDFAGEMLVRARTDLPSRCRLVQADMHEPPFLEKSFDLVVSSFTLRSAKNRARLFEEIHRILRPQGKVAFLCLTRPNSFLGRAVYAPYLKFYLPLVGGVLSKDRRAYQFLSDSIQSFPSPEEVGEELKLSGFGQVFLTPFTFRIATLILARKWT